MQKQKEELEAEIRQLVAKIIEVDPQKIGSDTNFVEELGADSMMALEIMATLEKKFGINIPEDQLMKLTSLTNVAKLVSALLSDVKK